MAGGEIVRLDIPSSRRTMFAEWFVSPPADVRSQGRGSMPLEGSRTMALAVIRANQHGVPPRPAWEESSERHIRDVVK